MDLVIEELAFKEVLPFKSSFTQEGLKLRNFKKTVWLGARYEGKLVGVCAYQRTRYGIKCRSDFVLKSYRKLGIYSRLFNERLKRVMRSQPVKVYAYCNKNSLPIYLRHGFVRKGRIRKYTYVEILPQKS